MLSLRPSGQPHALDANSWLFSNSILTLLVSLLRCRQSCKCLAPIQVGVWMPAVANSVRSRGDQRIAAKAFPLISFPRVEGCIDVN